MPPPITINICTYFDGNRKQSKRNRISFQRYRVVDYLQLEIVYSEKALDHMRRAFKYAVQCRKDLAA